MTIHLEHIRDPQPADYADIRQGLQAYNLSQQPQLADLKSGRRILTYHDGSTLIGGAIIVYEWGWLYVDTLWVDAAYRGLGIATQLMQAIESIALTHQLAGVYLMTSQFQAPDFYKKLGYQIWAELPDWPRAYTMTYFQKKSLTHFDPNPHIQLHDRNPELRQYLQEGLLKDSYPYTPFEYQSYVTKLWDDTQLIGGFYAFSFWDVLTLAILYIEPAYRQQSYGHQLLNQVQQLARQTGLARIILDTADFQAPDFYHQAGYQTYGLLEHRPPNNRSHFLTYILE